MHREAQRHAQHDRGHGGRAAPGVAAQLVPGKGAQKGGQHGPIVRRGGGMRRVCAISNSPNPEPLNPGDQGPI